jgi:hypothetical protein
VWVSGRIRVKLLGVWEELSFEHVQSSKSPVTPPAKIKLQYVSPLFCKTGATPQNKFYRRNKSNVILNTFHFIANELIELSK